MKTQPIDDFNIHHVPRVIAGQNAISELSSLVLEMNLNRVVLVTDRFLQEKTDLPDRVKKALGNRCTGIYAGVETDASAPSVDRGAGYAQEENAQLLVSLGGGSTIDTAKGMAVVMSLGGTILDHEGYHNIEQSLIPHIAIPTTTGTGSEMTMVTVIKDPQRGQKTFIGSRHVLPDIAILDPTLVIDLPLGLTAATAMDAMSHAVESLFSTLCQPFSDAYALEAIRLISAYLPKCLHEPGNLEYRGKLLIAASLAGSAFSNAMVSLNHAMAHVIGAVHGIHHGTANAMLLPHTIRYFSEAADLALIKAANAMNIWTRTPPQENAGEKVAQWLEKFIQDIGLTKRLSDFGVKEEDLSNLADLALTDGAIVYSPKPDIEPEDIIQIYRQAL